MNVTVLGAKTTTRYLLEGLLRAGRRCSLVTINPETGAQQQVADYDDLSDLNDRLDGFYVAAKYNLRHQRDLDHFAAHRGDLGLVVGWQRLVPEHVLATFSIGVFGMHGSSRNLPFGRGRSPMNWSILEGREWFYTNLFRYAPGVDDGDVFDTQVFSINNSDTAETLHFKNTAYMLKMSLRLIRAAETGPLQLVPQSSERPTYYPKREPSDGLIDWRNDISVIERHIRAVSPPFFGAFSYIGDNMLRILRASILFTDLEDHPYRGSTSWGEICDVFGNGKFAIRCLGGALVVHEYTLEGTATIAIGQQLNSPTEQIKMHPRNQQGYFDTTED